MPKTLSLSAMRRKLWLMGVVKIPMIAYVRPRLQTIDSELALVKIKLRRRTKNHLKSMYFGALSVGADVAAGLHAFYFAEQAGERVSFAFKSMRAEFIMRATTDVYFLSKDGPLVEKTFQEAVKTGERQNRTVIVEARNTNDEKVAIFEMEISVKIKS